MASSTPKSRTSRTPIRSFLARWRRRFLFWTTFGAVSLFGFILVCNLWVSRSVKNDIHDEPSTLPVIRVGLVLGTSSKFASGRKNLFFEYRMEAAAKAYHQGKVNHLLVSGDNRHSNYNEPQQMSDALVKMGVPETAITLDYAGLRTLDSVVRAKQIFGQDKLIIITQRAHAERALFIARFHDVDAVALAARDVPAGMALKTKVREWLAKCKAVLDLYLLNTKPRHLGDPEPIV